MMNEAAYTCSYINYNSLNVRNLNLVIVYFYVMFNNTLLLNIIHIKLFINPQNLI